LGGGADAGAPGRRRSTGPRHGSTGGFPKGERRDSNPRPPGPTTRRPTLYFPQECGVATGGHTVITPETGGFWVQTPPIPKTLSSSRHRTSPAGAHTSPYARIERGRPESAGSMGKEHSAGRSTALPPLVQLDSGVRRTAAIASASKEQGFPSYPPGSLIATARTLRPFASSRRTS
jgi:hypothetical protein